MLACLNTILLVVASHCVTHVDLLKSTVLFTHPEVVPNLQAFNAATGKASAPPADAANAAW